MWSSGDFEDVVESHLRNEGEEMEFFSVRDLIMRRDHGKEFEVRRSSLSNCVLEASINSDVKIRCP